MLWVVVVPLFWGGEGRGGDFGVWGSARRGGLRMTWISLVMSGRGGDCGWWA